MNSYAKSADSYLAQRVMSAGPEQQAALLMEAGQRFLGKAILAVQGGSHEEAARCYIRVTEIINEATCRLNFDEGGELVQNLIRMYGWWTHEIFEASRLRNTDRLSAVSEQMGEIRHAWENLAEKKAKEAAGQNFEVGERVV